jgi:hypothetical protein
VKLPAAVRRKLAAEASRRNVTQSVIVRESIERALADTRTNGHSASCADLVEDLLGSLKSGRKNLATNQTQLERVMLEGAQRGAKRRR